MTERDIRESKFLQHTAHEHLSVRASRRQLFETANYLLCQLALQIQELERANTNDDYGKQPEQSEQPEQAEEETPE